MGITDHQWKNLGSPGAYQIHNDGIDSTFYHCPVFPDQAAVWTPTALTGVYTMIRTTSTQGGVYVLSNQSSEVPVIVTFDGLNWTDYTVDFGTEASNRLEVVAHSFPLGDGFGCALEIDLGAEYVISDIEMLHNLTNQRSGSTVSFGWEVFDATHTTVGTGGGDQFGKGNGVTQTTNLSVPSLTGRYVWLFVGWIDAGAPNDGWIDSISITAATTNTIKTRFSTDNGATFSAARTAGDVPGLFSGFATQPVGNVVLVGTNGEVQLATAGSTYAPYATMPAGSQPSCIVIPARKNTGALNSGSTPDFIVASATLSDDDESVWYVSIGGTVFTSITPSDSGEFGLAVSANCLSAAYTNTGSRYAAVLDIDGIVTLFTTQNYGGAWASRGGVLDAMYIRHRRSDKTGQALYIASSAGALIVSVNAGANLQTRLSPSGAALIGCEPFN